MHRLMLALLVMGCASNEYTEGSLRLRWQPPPGVKLESEATEGGITTAHFSGGVDVRAVTASPPSTEGDLDKLKALLTTSAKMTVPGEVRMGRSGTIPAGPTVRWEMTSGSEKSLLYYVAGKERYVLISLTAPASSFDRRSDKMELSMASLKFQ